MGGAATESLANSGKLSPKRGREREREKRGGPEGRRGLGMVAAGGAGLNINPRDRPGRASVLVRFRLNSRNHAAVCRALGDREKRAKSGRFRRGHAGERTERPQLERRRNVTVYRTTRARIDERAVNRVGRTIDGRRRR